MVFDSDILNLPLEWIEGMGNRWLKALITFLAVFFWIIPVLVVFITPLLIFNALSGE
jgi:hypothetical protein